MYLKQKMIGWTCLLLCTALKVHHQNAGPKIDVLAAITWDTEKEVVLKDPKQILLKFPRIYLQSRAPAMGTFHSWQDSKGFSIKLLPAIPLNNQGETKIKINEKTIYSSWYQSNTFYFKLHPHWTTNPSEWKTKFP